MSAQRDTIASIRRPDVVAATAAVPRRRRRRRSMARAAAIVVLLAAASAAAGVIVATLQKDGGSSTVRELAALADRLPAAPRSPLRIPEPERLDRIERGTATWAPVRRAALARMAPSRTAPSVGRIAASTPAGTSEVVRVLDRRRDGDGLLWVRVQAASLDQRSTGWIPRSAIGGLRTARTHLVVNRRERTATLVREGRVVVQLPVAIGAAASPTPAGSFYVRYRLEGYDSPAYGPVAFATSAQNALGPVGIHGTARPQAVSGATSSGSIVLRNADIARLARSMPVGTPVTIR
jgi:lipoprotein-anchoring transpeptidase ErfK/SrfK